MLVGICVRANPFFHMADDSGDSVNFDKFDDTDDSDASDVSDGFDDIRGKSLLELWGTTFLPDWQPPLIFVRFISNFLCMCSNSMASAHVILK